MGSSRLPGTVSLAPSWARSMPAAPAASVSITPAYAKHVGRDAYLWACPMVNVFNRRLHCAVACPNQDVVYGIGALALDESPVVVQVPDFGDRFWVYQAVDLRTDSFVQLGAMYATTPGFCSADGVRQPIGEGYES